jgi:hypothetical protein
MNFYYLSKNFSQKFHTRHPFECFLVQDYFFFHSFILSNFSCSQKCKNPGFCVLFNAEHIFLAKRELLPYEKLFVTIATLKTCPFVNVILHTKTFTVLFYTETMCTVTLWRLPFVLQILDGFKQIKMSDKTKTHAKS